MIQTKIDNQICEYLDSPVVAQINLKGFDSLMSQISGFRSQQINLVVAETGFGKSNLMVDWSTRLARENVKVLFFSSEMGMAKTTPRFMANLLDMSKNQAEKLHKEYQTEMDDERKKDTKDKVIARAGNLPLILEFDRTIEDILAKVIKAKEEYGVQVVMIDHLLILNSVQKFNNQTDLVSEILQQMELISLQYDICFIVATQFNKAGEKGLAYGNRELKDVAGGRDVGHLVENVLYFYETEDQKKKNDKNPEAYKTGYESTISSLKGRNGEALPVQLIHFKNKSKITEIPGQNIILENL